MSKPLNRDILACPLCKTALTDEDRSLHCPSCRHSYPREGVVPVFEHYTAADITDPVDALKHLLKSFPRLYSFLIYVISPVYISDHLRSFLRRYVLGKDIVALNLGSGATDLSENITNIDIFRYPNIDVVGDIGRLPLRNDSVDVVIISAVLEHVPDPGQVVREILRVLKKGGVVYAYFPFIYGFHASPRDYSRMTHEGMKVLFRDFTLLAVENAGGPTSGFLCVFQEWAALLLSFGSTRLYRALHILAMLTTFPLKFIDIALARHPMARNIAAGFSIVAQKH